MNRKRHFVTLCLLAGFILLSCNLPSSLAIASPTATPEIEITDDPTTTLIDTVTAFTASPLITDTPTVAPSSTFTATLSPSPSQSPVLTPCNRASFVADITYPDNTEIAKDTSFVKTWRLQNNGSCTWTSGYKLIFSHGDRMNAPDEVTFTSGTIAPGGTVDVSVNLKSPSGNGTYRGNFKLKAPDGQVFGIGADATANFYVQIKVIEPAAGITLVPLIPLPIIPLLQVSYDASFVGEKNCFGPHFFLFKIGNTGNTVLESYSLSLTDNTTASLHGNYGNDSFTSKTECIAPVIGAIETSNKGYIGVKENSDVSGHSMTANIKICTKDGLGGICVERSVTFTAD